MPPLTVILLVTGLLALLAGIFGYVVQEYRRTEPVPNPQGLEIGDTLDYDGRTYRLDAMEREPSGNTVYIWRSIDL